MKVDVIQSYIMALMFLIVITILLTSCATNTIITDQVFVPDAYLLSECKPLKPLPYDDMGDLVKIIVNDAAQYKECSMRHEQLIESYYIYIKHVDELNDK